MYWPSLPALAAIPAQYQRDERKNPYREATSGAKWRVPGARLYRSSDDGLAELRCSHRDRTIRRDQCADTIVGTTDEVTSQFSGAKAGHLKMLPGPNALAEPRIVADGDQHIRISGMALYEVWINNFVTDEGCDSEVPRYKRALNLGPLR